MKKIIIKFSLIFLISCSVSKGYSLVEYDTLLDNLMTKRPYPVVREPYAVPMLVDALKEPAAVVRFNAGHDLKALGPEAHDALIPLINCYKDVDFKVAQMCFVASTRVIGEPYREPRASSWFFSAAPDPADNLALYLKSGSTQQKIWSLNLLLSMGKSAKNIINPIIANLSDSSSEVREAAAQVLIETEADINQELVNDLNNNKASIAYILGKRGHKDAIGQIEPMLSDESSAVRMAAAQSLLLLGFNSSEQAKVLASSLNSASANERQKIISTLNSSGNSSYVANYNRQKKQEKERSVKRAKSKIKSRARAASNKVRNKLLRDRNEIRKAQALSPNNRIQSKKEIPLLNSAVVNANATQAIDALTKLSELAPFFPDAYSPILKSLNHENPLVRAHSASLLGSIRRPDSVNSLILTLEDENSTVRDSAIVALLTIATPEAVNAVNNFPEETKRQALRRITNNENSKLQPLVRCAEARSLCKLYLQKAGSTRDTIVEEAKQCAYYVQPSC